MNDELAHALHTAMGKIITVQVAMLIWLAALSVAVAFLIWTAP
jgi:hypothetical protein